VVISPSLYFPPLPHEKGFSCGLQSVFFVTFAILCALCGKEFLAFDRKGRKEVPQSSQRTRITPSVEGGTPIGIVSS
jgi:hypothetical protein